MKTCLEKTTQPEQNYSVALFDSLNNIFFYLEQPNLEQK